MLTRYVVQLFFRRCVQAIGTADDEFGYFIFDLELMDPHNSDPEDADTARDETTRRLLGD